MWDQWPTLVQRGFKLLCNSNRNGHHYKKLHDSLTKGTFLGQDIVNLLHSDLLRVEAVSWHRCSVPKLMSYPIIQAWVFSQFHLDMGT